MIPLRSFSVVRGKKILTENCDTPSLTPLLIQKTHETWNIVKNRKVPLRKFSAFLDEKCSKESFDTPHFLSRNFLATGLLLKHSRERFP